MTYSHLITLKLDPNSCLFSANISHYSILKNKLLIHINYDENNTKDHSIDFRITN